MAVAIGINALIAASVIAAALQGEWRSVLVGSVVLVAGGAVVALAVVGDSDDAGS